jgi:hypothetical protein
MKFTAGVAAVGIEELTRIHLRRPHEKRPWQSQGLVEQKKDFVGHSCDNNSPVKHFLFLLGMRISRLVLVPSGIGVRRER